MEINWFPGHMAKSTREIENDLAVCDCVVYVLDCRAVRSCFNPQFDRMIHKPIVYVLNKSDMVEASCVKAWTERLSSGENIAIATVGTGSGCRKTVLRAIDRVCAAKLERQRARGLNPYLKAMVIGVPNTGKSTIVNSLCGKVKADTGDRAGVTRTAKWVRVDGKLDVLDTPGTLYPKITDRRIGENLAVIGSIRDEVLDPEEKALALVARLNEIDPAILEARFGQALDEESALETVARKRGYKLRGGEDDTERAAIALVDDFRKGRLGKIALERA